MTTLVAMTDVEFAAYAAQTVPAYAATKVASGEWTAGESLALARKAFAELLPDGLATRDSHLFTIRKSAETEAIGMLWYSVRKRAGARIAYVYDLNIEAAHRCQGHASRALKLLDVEARKQNLAGVALHVFAQNLGALSVYRKLGFESTDISMYKALEPDIDARETRESRS